MALPRLAVRNIPLSQLSTFASYTRAFTSLTVIPKLLPCSAPTSAASASRAHSILRARTFTSTAARKVNDTSEKAPSAQAYLASGAIAGGGDLVDVNKVLVIGSGGLSIGQAGEFDYSGT